MEKAYLEILEGILDELARLGVPEERLRPLREELLALKVVRMMQAPSPPLWSRPLFWTAVALFLAVLGAFLGLPVHRLFP
ncbi:hypothetical protein [Thermus sp.]|uniref:hypothetical protein n=1 Tax=Thermus sp. TaxID=275 RepID=UPI0025F93A46|nr:hypothetical protein [Thermus sp.]MCS6867508.1 hypothetical protein [Thermus sp.]MDW8358768.1 hypothetical protein [Thermus sp.]